FGWVDIDVLDEQGRATPARMGIYDLSGHAPLPSDEALLIKNNRTGANRLILFRQGPTQGPLRNSSAFYTDGHYHTRLPAGDYEVLAAKGLEYRLFRQHFTVRENQAHTIKIQLQRWVDMVGNGWYSGDDHMHYTRLSGHDDQVLQQLTRAEDL